MDVISHRGACLEYPENTLAAFERAVEIGVDALETDLLLTRDGRMVLRHDDLIEWNSAWHYVRDLSSAELRQMDMGGGHGLLFFEDFLDRFEGKLPLLLDLKCPGLGDALVHFFASRGRPRNIHFTSFIHDEIKQLVQAFPDCGHSIVLAALPIEFKPLFDSTGAREISLFRGYLTQQTVETLHRHQIGVRVYPVNLLWEAQKLKEWKVAGIFTDDPAALQSLRR